MLPVIGAAAGFLGKNWKLVAIGGAALALYFAYNGYQDLKNDKAQLEGNQAVLEGAVEVERASLESALGAIEDWQMAQKKLQKKIEEMNAFSVEANEEVRRLDELFANHDFGALVLAKPGLMERRINSGTRRIFRMLETATTDTTRRGLDGS